MSIADEPSVNNISQTSTGWNVDAKSQFAIDDTWRAGYDLAHASDRDYLRYYDYTLTAPYLTSRPYLEGFSSRDYFSVEAYSFQNQTDTPAATPTGVPNKTPTILPLITYSAQSPQGWQGSYWSFDTHAASIMRVDNQTDSRRINSLASWHLPYTTHDGQAFNFATSLRADVYDSDNIPGFRGRTGMGLPPDPHRIGRLALPARKDGRAFDPGPHPDRHGQCRPLRGQQFEDPQ